MKASETACPFCGTGIVASIAGPTEGRVVRDRAVLLFGAAAIAGLAVAGCNNNATTDGTGGGASGTPTNAMPPPTAPTHEPTGVVMPYGVPIPHDNPPPLAAADAGSDAGRPKPPPPPLPNPTAVPAYGLPMPTSSQPVPKK